MSLCLAHKSNGFIYLPYSLAVVPFVIGFGIGCSGFFFILGFLANLAIAGLYGKLLLGHKYVSLH